MLRQFLASLWVWIVVVLTHPLFALVFGTFLAVGVPYVRALLQKVAEKGHWRDLGMPFDWRYLAMFLIPLLEVGVSLFITQGLLDTVRGWEWTYAAMLGYTGSDIAKEVTKAGRAVQRWIGTTSSRRPNPLQ